ncbi:helix-turn-helix domain-containing protein [Streptomyces sp. M19]
MEKLAGQLTALDPDAGSAVQVITYFDRLITHHAGLEAVVRGRRCCPAAPRAWSTPTGPYGSGSSPTAAAAARTPGTARVARGPAGPDGSAAIRLERPGPANVVEAMVLERAAFAARLVLERTGPGPGARPGRRPGPDRDGARPHRPGRRPAARRPRPRPGPAGRARALARPGGTTHLRPDPDPDPVPDPGPGTDPSEGRVGWARPCPSSTSTAPPPRPYRPALHRRRHRPGPRPRVVHADALGALALLADAVGPDTEPPPDLLALDRAAARAPWLLATLTAVADAASLRTAATGLHVHHSTLQDRLTQAETLLGWPLRTPGAVSVSNSPSPPAC